MAMDLDPVTSIQSSSHLMQSKYTQTEAAWIAFFPFFFGPSFTNFIYFHTLCPSVPLSESFQFTHIWYSLHVNSKFIEVPACSCFDYG